MTRHIWQAYTEPAEDCRYAPEYGAIYERRKETIERCFADAKEKHAMSYTPYRELSQASKWVGLKFAAMNLKKLAVRRRRERTLVRFFFAWGLPMQKRASSLA